MARMTRGFTLVELIVVLTLIVIFVATAFENLLPLVGKAEQVAVEQTRVNIDTALRTTAAERLVQEGSAAVRELANGNPVDLLARPPGNYLGELAGPNPSEVPPGHWYWDTANEWLVYRVRHSRYFQSSVPGPARIRFKLERQGSRDFFVLHLESLERYVWDTEGSEMARWFLSKKDQGREPRPDA